MHLGLLETPTPYISDGQCGGASLAESLDNECGEQACLLVADGGDDGSSGLDGSDAIEYSELGHIVDSLLFGQLVVTQSRPWLEPALAGELEANRTFKGLFRHAIEIDGQD